jgi:hypothetical protein
VDDPWLQFEQRIQERRYYALLESTRTALAAGDRQQAERALAEARALQPDSVEVALLEREASAIRRRITTYVPHLAVALLIGVALVLAINTSRLPTQTQQETQQDSAQPPSPDVPESTTGESESLPGEPLTPSVPAITPAPGAEPAAASPPEQPSAPERATRTPAPPASPPASPLALSAHGGVDYALRRYARTFTGSTFDMCDITVLDTSADGVCRTRGNAAWRVRLARQGYEWIVESAVEQR